MCVCHFSYLSDSPPCCSRPCGLWAKSWGSAGMPTEPPAWQPCALKRPCRSSAFRRTLKSEVSRALRKSFEQDPTPDCKTLRRKGPGLLQRTHKVRQPDGESYSVKYSSIDTPASLKPLDFWQTLPRLPSQTTKNIFPVLSSATAARPEPFCSSRHSLLTRILGFPVLLVCNR